MNPKLNSQETIPDESGTSKLEVPLAEDPNMRFPLLLFYDAPDLDLGFQVFSFVTQQNPMFSSKSIAL
jgi:hypothetical protein